MLKMALTLNWNSSSQVKNTKGKGEIARFEQFLLFPQCFQKTSAADTYKPGLVWERVKHTTNKIGFIGVQTACLLKPNLDMNCQ